MKLMRSLAPLAAVVLLTAGMCDDDSTDPDNDITTADLAGDYTISSFTYTPDAGGAPINLTGLGLGVTALSVEADGSFEGTLRFPHPATGTPTNFPIGGTISLANETTTDADLTIAFDAATQALGILDATETGSLGLASDGTLTMTLTEVTVPAGLPGGGAEADLVMVASLN